MPSSKLSHWLVMGACLVPLSVVAASLLIGGVASSAPPEGAPQSAQALVPAATTTVLEVSPNSPVTLNTEVILTARITPSNAVGTVQFKDGATDIGPPVPVSSDGTAAGSTRGLVLGSRSLTAVFSPADPTVFGPSRSQVVNYVIGVPSGSTISTGSTSNTGMAGNTGMASTGAMGTGITLVTSPAGIVSQGTPAILTATLTPSTAVGTVQFKDGATDIGGPIQVTSNGTAAGSTSTLPPGTRQLTAVFTPANPAMFSPSTSAPVALTVVGSGAGVVQVGDFQQSGLSLDIRVSLLGDLDGRSGILDRCGCPSVQGAHGRTTILDGRPSVLDGNEVLDGVLSVALGLR